MSQHNDSSAPLPLSLWLLLLLTPITQTTSSAPLDETGLRPTDAALLIDGGASGLRNCSCPAPVRDCDEAQANSLCRCHDVLRSDLPLAGLREPGQVTVWVRDVWVLEEFLNKSTIGHLSLSFCGIKPMESRYLALLGLRTLRIRNDAPEAPYPNQEITIAPEAGLAAELKSLPFDSSVHVTFLDVAVMNGLSSLKAYSVVGPTAPTFSQHFSHLAWLYDQDTSRGTTENPEEPEQNLLITFVY